MSKIVLPRTDKEGNYYISYSQIKNWNSDKSFNLKILGKMEYILEYFFKEDFGDMGWAQFGTEVEEFILERKHSGVFTSKEKEVLETITPLEVPQQEIRIEFDGFYLKGFMDDATKDFKHIRDYKTCSLNSSKQYYEDGYYQLDIYGMWVKQETGALPEKAEVVMVERAGSAFKWGGRKNLSVKEEVWNHDRELTEERQEYLRGYINKTALEISEVYKVFLKMKGC
ncbi:MAG: PD-(D/E)XK nuclease family protein [Candidatus Peribacteraceae bacterium]|nr:PD-(D/E)XK nuclease family protein [Candidatus Peribacteraceae bacterium]